jgi:hypothetical protein
MLAFTTVDRVDLERDIASQWVGSRPGLWWEQPVDPVGC